MKGAVSHDGYTERYAVGDTVLFHNGLSDQVAVIIYDHGDGVVNLDVRPDGVGVHVATIESSIPFAAELPELEDGETHRPPSWRFRPGGLLHAVLETTEG